MARTWVNRWLTLMLLTLTVVGAAGTVMVDGPWPNLLAELAGVALGSLVTVLVIESHLEARREEAWEDLRIATYDVLISTAQSAFLDASLAALGWTAVAPIVGFMETPEEHRRDVQELIAALHADRDSESYAAGWAAVEEEAAVFARYADRLMSLGSQPQLVSLLVDVERTAASLRTFAAFDSSVHSSDGTASSGLPYSVLGQFVEATAAVHEYVLPRRWPHGRSMSAAGTT